MIQVVFYCADVDIPPMDSRITDKSSPRSLILGFGLMGSALADVLNEAGHEILILDADPSRLSETPWKVAGSLDECLDQIDLIWVCVMTTAQISTALETSLSGIRRRMTVLDLTTSMPNEKSGLAEILSSGEHQYIDACVAGNSAQLRNRQVMVLAGCCPQEFEAGKELLKLISDRVIYCGSAGAGASAKLVFNHWLGLQRAILSEALFFAEKSGVNPAMAVDMLLGDPAHQSDLLKSKASKMIERDYEPVARLDQHAKDVDLMLTFAGSSGFQLPFANLHHRILEAASNLNLGQSDNSAVIEFWRQKNGEL